VRWRRRSEKRWREKEYKGEKYNIGCGEGEEE
jgi:hypothetical protein